MKDETNRFQIENRILIVVPNDKLGGAEQILKMIAEYHSNKGIVDIHFLSKKNTGSWEYLNSNLNVSYSKFNSQYLGALELIYKLFIRLIFNKNKYYQIFTSHVFVTGLIGIALKMKLIQTKYFVGRESTHIFERFTGVKLKLYKFMYKFGYPSLDLLICQTDSMRLSLIKNQPNIEKFTNIKVLPNPVNPPKLISYKKFDYNFIVTAGRLIKEKGFDILIEAYKISKPTLGDLKLVILGEGPERQSLSQLINSYNLENDIILEGFVDDVYPYFKNAKICVVSSRVEGFPNVLLQMMTTNTRIISTNCAGSISEIPSISVVETHNAEMLASTLSNVYAKNTNSRNRIIFDEYLSNRSLEYFIQSISTAL